MAIHNILNFTCINGFDSSTLSPSSWDDAVFGLATVKSVSRVQPSGLESTVFGQAVAGSRGAVFMSGFDASACGQPLVWNHTSYITPEGLDSGAVGSALVHSASLVQPSGFDAAAFGSALVGIFNRIAPAGLDVSVFGSPEIMGRKGIYPSGLAPGGTGSASVFNWLSYLEPAGFAAGACGQAVVYNLQQFIELAGLDAGSFGQASISNLQRFLALAGLDAEATGTVIVTGRKAVIVDGLDSEYVNSPTVYTHHAVIPSGFAPSAFGLPLVRHDHEVIIVPALTAAGYGTVKVFNWRNFIKPGGTLSQASGEAHLESTIRTIQFFSANPSPVNWPFVTHAVRSINPLPLAGMIGTAVVGGSQILGVSGLDSEVHGLALVHDNTQFIMAFHVDESGIGTALFSRSPRVLSPAGATGADEGVQNGQWGNAVVWNLLQIVQHYNEDLDPMGGIFGAWTEIFNRNRTVGFDGYGLDAARYSRGTNVYQTPVVKLQGLDSEDCGAALVSHWLRTVIPESMQGIPLSQFMSVWNAAAELHPAGITPGDAGLPLLANTRRYFDHIGGLDQTQFGEAFVADAVRTVSVYYPPGGFPVSAPWVSFLNRTLTPAAIEAGFGGLAELFIHHNIITPRWPTRMDITGAALVYNNTPELRPWGLFQTEGGTPYVGLYTRTLKFSGLVQTLFGATTRVRDRRIWIQAQGVAAPDMSQTHSVLHIPPITEFPQTIEPTWLFDGQPCWHTGVFGNAVVESSIRDITRFGELDAAYGKPLIIYYGINFQGTGAYTSDPTQYGQPTVISYQTIAKAGLGDSAAIPEPTVSPFYIRPWRDLAGLSHTDFSWLYGEQFGGETGIILQNRTVSVASIPHYPPLPEDAITGPAVSMKVRTVKPAGFESMRKGYAYVGGPRTLIPPGAALEQCGMAALRIQAVGDQTVSCTGGAGTAWGATLVQLWNRAVTPFGWDVSEPGMAYVHPPIPHVVQGFDASAFGTTEVGYRIRSVRTAGFEADSFGYGAGNFAGRMKVKRGQPLMVRGFAPTVFGTAGRVSRKTQVIGAKSVTGIIGGARSVSLHTRTLQPYPCLYWPPPFGRASFSKIP
jgi:hypothetical protein